VISCEGILLISVSGTSGFFSSLLLLLPLGGIGGGVVLILQSEGEWKISVLQFRLCCELKLPSLKNWFVWGSLICFQISSCVQTDSSGLVMIVWMLPAIKASFLTIYISFL
jgi:hypothetical protein